MEPCGREPETSLMTVQYDAEKIKFPRRVTKPRIQTRSCIAYLILTTVHINNGYAYVPQFDVLSTSCLMLKLVALGVINGAYRFKSLVWAGWRNQPPLLHFVYGKLFLKFRT